MKAGFTDAELICSLKEGSQKAFAEIYNRYWYKLFCVAYHETGSREDAEELVHDLFESLWNKRDQAVIRHLSAYLVISIKHLVTNYIKSKITHRRYQEYLILHELHQAESTDETVQFSDLSKAVEEVMKKLPEKTCEVFRLSRFENKPVKDIARQLSLSEKAVEYHITKSLKVLQGQLKVYQSDN
ncbi:RNA polymerase sigma factor [Spirosoma koreense]